MKTSLPIILVLAVYVLLSNGARSSVGVAAEGIPERGRLSELEQRVAKIETHLGHDALGWRNSGSVAKRLETLERKMKDTERDKQPSFPRKMNSPTLDSNRLAVDLRSLRHDLETLRRRVRDHSTQLLRNRGANGSGTNRREIERLQRDVQELRGDLQRLDRR